MLRWPQRAQAAIRKLFEPLQSIDVYVEDKNDEAFYKCLLNNATQGKVQIARVFGLGGQQAVINAATSYDHRQRPALFIIDGDFPWVRGEAAPKIPGLHRHNAYCVENLLLCEEATVTILSQEVAVTEDAAKAQLKYQDWKRSLLSLIDLFAAYATVNEYKPSLATVSRGVGHLCTQSGSCATLDLNKINHSRDHALEAATLSEPLATERHRRLHRRLLALKDPLMAVSGKDFILPLLNFHLSSFGCRIKKRSLRIRLAAAGNMTRFSYLAEALLLAARGQR